MYLLPLICPFFSLGGANMNIFQKTNVTKMYSCICLQSLAAILSKHFQKIQTVFYWHRSWNLESTFLSSKLYTLWFLLLNYFVHTISTAYLGRGMPPLFLFLMVSSILPFSRLKGFFGEFFPIWFEGLRTEGAVSCKDGKTPWGKLWFVILSYINKTDLTWHDISAAHLTERSP